MLSIRPYWCGSIRTSLRRRVKTFMCPVAFNLFLSLLLPGSGSCAAEELGVRVSVNPNCRRQGDPPVVRRTSDPKRIRELFGPPLRGARGKSTFVARRRWRQVAKSLAGACLPAWLGRLRFVTWEIEFLLFIYWFSSCASKLTQRHCDAT